MNPTIPPSLPPAMDPHQMNDTPPCPNATPEQYYLFRRGLYFRPNAEGYTSKESEAGLFSRAQANDFVRGTVGDSEPVTMKAAPTAPLPTVAPHLAGLVERLEKLLEAHPVWHQKLDPEEPMISHNAVLNETITDAIAALTEGARERERLQRGQMFEELVRVKAQLQAAIAERDEYLAMLHRTAKEAFDLDDTIGGELYDVYFIRQVTKLRAERDALDKEAGELAGALEQFVLMSPYSHPPERGWAALAARAARREGEKR